MSFTKTLLAGMLIVAPLGSVMAETTSGGCEEKRQDIEKQIEYAQSWGNQHRVTGLQKALSELNAHCTDEGLRQERESDIRKKERKVEERRQELTEARADGRAKKIRDKQEKLEEAQEELSEARSLLNR